MKFSTRIRNLVLCSASALAIVPSVASAGDRWDKDRRRDRDVDVRVDIEFSRDRFPRRDPDDCVTYEKRVWVEPVYRTVCDRVWVEAVYRDVCDRVWVEPVFEERCERVWVEARYEYRDVIRVDFRGAQFRARERVCVEPAHWEDRGVRVCVREGYWDDVRRRECVSEGHWKTIERRECVSEGYWTTKVVRNQHGGDYYARGDRGDRYRD
jgi:hypothetical protein